MWIVGRAVKTFFDQFKLPEGFWRHIAGKVMAPSNRELNAVKPVTAVCVTAISNIIPLGPTDLTFSRLMK